MGLYQSKIALERDFRRYERERNKLRRARDETVLEASKLEVEKGFYRRVLDDFDDEHRQRCNTELRNQLSSSTSQAGSAQTCAPYLVVEKEPFRSQPSTSKAPPMAHERMETGVPPPETCPYVNHKPATKSDAERFQVLAIASTSGVAPQAAIASTSAAAPQAAKASTSAAAPQAAKTSTSAATPQAAKASTSAAAPQAAKASTSAAAPQAAKASTSSAAPKAATPFTSAAAPQMATASMSAIVPHAAKASTSAAAPQAVTAAKASTSVAAPQAATAFKSAATSQAAATRKSVVLPQVSGVRKSISAQRGSIRATMSALHERTIFKRKDDTKRCQICKKSYEENVFQCKNGHSACEICWSLDLSCKLCTGTVNKFSNTRNSDIQNYIMANRPVKCPNAAEGCTLLFRKFEMIQHEQECPYRKLQCPFLGNCNWRGKITNLSLHYDEHHPSCMQASVATEMTQDLGYEYHTQQLIKIGNYNFLFYVKVSNSDRKVYMDVQLIGSVIAAAKWYYEIHVYSKGEPRRKYKCVNSCRPYIEAPGICLSGCAVLPIPYAMGFVNAGYLNYKIFIKKTF